LLLLASYRDSTTEMPTEEKELADWRRSELSRLAAQLKILRRKVQQGKGWPGIEPEIEEKEAAYRAHIVCQDMEEQGE
jgi:hypothetical protein